MNQAYPRHFRIARQAISGYLFSLREVGLQPAREVPPIPSLDSLRTAKLPLVSDRIWQERLNTIKQRRMYLLALVEQSGWSWKYIDCCDGK